MGKRYREKVEYSDIELIQGCSEGKSLPRELLYKRYFSYAMSISLRYTRDESEAMEIVNDSYLKVLEKLEDYDRSKPFKPWFGKIVVNSAIDAYRRNTRHNSTLSVIDIAETEEQEPDIESELSVSDILSLFSQLPEHYKVTFNLYEIEGYTHEEIGKMLGINTATSRSNLTRAKKLIRELYIKNFNPVKKSHEAI